MNNDSAWAVGTATIAVVSALFLLWVFFAIQPYGFIGQSIALLITGLTSVVGLGYISVYHYRKVLAARSKKNASKR